MADRGRRGDKRVSRLARRQFALAAALGTALIVSLAAASVSAAWTPYASISKQQDVEHPLVEMDPAGDAVFLWMQGFDSAGHPAIYTRVRTADGSLSPIQRISSEFGGYDLAVDSEGNAYYVWTDLDSGGREHLRTRVRYADGTLSPVQTLKTVGPSDFVFGTVDVDASGAAVFAWIHRRSDGSDRLQARTRSASGALGPVSTVSPDVSGFNLAMGVDASGDTTFAWDGAGSQRGIFSRVLTTGGSLGPVMKVSRPGQLGADVQVVVTPSGRALFEWEEDHLDTDRENLMVRARSAGGSFQPPQVVANIAALAPVPTERLAVAPTGEAAFSWRTEGAWHARTRAPGGALRPTRTIVPKLIYDSDVGIDSHGNAVFVWSVPDGSKTQVFVRSEDAGGTLSPIRRVSLAGYNAGAPDLAMTPAGDAAVTWQAGNAGFAIQAAFGP
jgi:hypothetical protein